MLFAWLRNDYCNGSDSRVINSWTDGDSMSSDSTSTPGHHYHNLTEFEWGGGGGETATEAYPVVCTSIHPPTVGNNDLHRRHVSGF